MPAEKHLTIELNTRFDIQGFCNVLLHLACNDKVILKWFQQIIPAKGSNGQRLPPIVNTKLSMTEHVGYWMLDSRRKAGDIIRIHDKIWTEISYAGR